MLSLPIGNSFSNEGYIKIINGDFSFSSGKKLSFKKITKKADDVLYIDGRRVTLFLTKEQKINQFSHGVNVLNEIEQLTSLNVEVLEYLLKNPSIIPLKWKNVGYIFFGGTIYSKSNIHYVNCLRWECGIGFYARFCEIENAIYRSSSYAAII